MVDGGMDERSVFNNRLEGRSRKGIELLNSNGNDLIIR